MTEPTSPTPPIYADRATGQTFADARAMINAYLERYAAHIDITETSVGDRPSQPSSKLELDAAGYAQFQRDRATVGINVLEAHGVLVIFAPVAKLPMVGREAFYRRLLELSFLETSDAAFAINAAEDEVVVRCLRRLSALDYEEFEDLLNTVSSVADKWDALLLREYGP